MEEERNATTIREVLQLFSPPLRLMIEEPAGAPRVGVQEEDEEEDEKDEEEDPVRLALRDRGMTGDSGSGEGELYHDLFVFLRPGSIAMDAAWKAAPLVLHDKGLVAASEDLIKNLPYLAGQVPDLRDTISKILRRHPGPVALLRVDCSVCPGPELLADWMDELSGKAVQRLAMVNLSQPRELEFPLHLLHGDGSLISLEVGFFSIGHELGEDFDTRFGSLATLTLAGCAFDGGALSTVIHRCCALRTLRVWGSDLTAGCGSDGLTIGGLLRVLELTIKSPVLQLLGLGVRPAKGVRQVTVNTPHANALKEISHLTLHLQDFMFKTTFAITVQRHKLAAFHSMQRLSIFVNMAHRDQSWDFIRLLRRMPHLLNLTIWDGLLSCPCLTSSLRILVMKQYRGGVAEVAFTTAVLSCGRFLTQVDINPHATLSRSEQAAISEMLEASPRASQLPRAEDKGVFSI
ncbi:hypothetical protein EJB05_20611, partial [Eragrostis curvula]